MSIEIKEIDKSQASTILNSFHYLSKISKGFKSGINIGLFIDNELLGVCIFTGFPVPELVVGLFGLPRTDQIGFFELSRLCLHPSLQIKGKNIASQFLAKSIKYIRKNYSVRAILSYADSDFHTGTIYQACNFKYYGLTDEKKDFFVKQKDGSFSKLSRGKTKGIEGEWRNRSRKHRYLLIFDKSLTPLWKEDNYPKKVDTSN